MLQDLRLWCLRDLLLKAGVPRRACLTDAGVGPLIHLLEGLVMNDCSLGVDKLVHFLTTDHGVVIQWHLWVNILVVTAVLFHKNLLHVSIRVHLNCWLLTDNSDSALNCILVSIHNLMFHSFLCLHADLRIIATRSRTLRLEGQGRLVLAVRKNILQRSGPS